MQYFDKDFEAKIMAKIIGEWMLKIGPNMEENKQIQLYLDGIIQRQSDLKFKTIVPWKKGAKFVSMSQVKTELQVSHTQHQCITHSIGVTLTALNFPGMKQIPAHCCF